MGYKARHGHPKEGAFKKQGRPVGLSLEGCRWVSDAVGLQVGIAGEGDSRCKSFEIDVPAT